MSLDLLDAKLKKIQTDKVVKNADDLFVIEHISSTISKINGIYNSINNVDDIYFSSLSSKLKEFENYFQGLVVGRVAQMGIDLNSVNAVSSRSTNSDKQNLRSFSSKSGLKSLKDVMKELSSATKNFKQRKNTQINATVQQENVIDNVKKDDFLSGPKHVIKAEPVAETQETQIKPSVQEQSPSVAQPAEKKPVNVQPAPPIENSQADIISESENTTQQSQPEIFDDGGSVDIPLNFSGGNNQQNGALNAGKDYILRLLKSKGK